jgi:hypothetical protein
MLKQGYKAFGLPGMMKYIQGGVRLSCRHQGIDYHFQGLLLQDHVGKLVHCAPAVFCELDQEAGIAQVCDRLNGFNLRSGQLAPRLSADFGTFPPSVLHG